MSHTPTFDAKMKAILDAAKPGERVCELTGEKWLMTDEEIGWYKKFNVPPSKRSPLARTRLRCGFWTGFSWWNHKDPNTGKTLISYVHPATGLKVLADKEWHANDFSSIYREVDPSKSFFDQFRELQLRIPYPASRNVVEPENSIAAVSMGDRNSYFVLGCKSEDSLFSIWVDGLSHSAMVNNAKNIVNSYFVDNARNVHNSVYVRDSADVINSAFIFLSVDVDSCFGATNAYHKKYIWFDEQLTKGEWERRRAEVDFSCRKTYEAYLEKFHELVAHTVWPENMSDRVENVTGEYNYDSHDLSQCYSCVHQSSNLFWCNYAVDGHDSAFSTPVYSDLCYEGDNSFHSHDIKFSYGSYRCQSMEYCFLNYDCENCFGCVGLQKKKFHIFNKPYAETEYWKKVDEIKCAMLDRGEYGNFFPLSFSPSYFGQSGAVLYYAATPEMWEQLGGGPFDPESAGAIGELEVAANMKKSGDIPDCIDAVTDEEWASVPIFDEKNGRRFAFLKPELAFYRERHQAPPNIHFVHRILNLLRETNTGVMEEVVCAKCGTSILVAKNLAYPKRMVYCQDCYVQFLETK